MYQILFLQFLTLLDLQKDFLVLEDLLERKDGIFKLME